MYYYVSVEVLTAVYMKIIVFCDVINSFVDRLNVSDNPATSTFWIERRSVVEM
jgi:hypothetical protein